MNTKGIKIILFLFLLLGTVFGWHNVSIVFSKFYEFNNDMFRFRDCISSNPLLTSIFWNSIIFSIALIWIYRIYQKIDYFDQYTSTVNLIKFLLIGVVLELINFSYEVYRYASQNLNELQTCVGVVNSPLKSSSFYILIILLASLVAAISLKVALDKEVKS